MPANDNKAPADQEVSGFLRALVAHDDASAEARCRRGERTANTVVIIMAICLVSVPLLYVSWLYAGIVAVP